MMEDSSTYLQEFKKSHENYTLNIPEDFKRHRPSLRTITIPKPPKPSNIDKPTPDTNDDYGDMLSTPPASNHSTKL